jgi:hypothetical protein
MSDLQAGAARIALEPKIGTDLVGFADKQETVGIHDPLHARALVLDDGNTALALCSIEVCFFAQDIRNALRPSAAPRRSAFFCQSYARCAFSNRRTGSDAC